MDLLPPESKRIKQATAAEKLAAVLDALESKFIPQHAAEHELKRIGHTREGVIDLSDASNMHLLREVAGAKVHAQLQSHLSEFLKSTESYPPRFRSAPGLEEAFVSFLKRWTNISVAPQDVVVFNGVYGAFQTLTLSQPGKYVLVPEFVHQMHKAAFTALGKKVIEIPINIYSFSPFQALNFQSLQSIEFLKFLFR